MFAGSGLVQLVPQPPQWLALFVVFVSQPLAGLPSQLAKPLLQAGAQVPLAQATLPFGLLHAMPQPPQWLVLELVFVSQPLLALPSQLPEPALQLGVQLPPMQAVVPFGLLHVVPHAPQLPALVVRLVSQPLLAMPSQLPQPGAQLGTQLPAVQVVVPCGLVHESPHEPQLATLFVRFVSQPLLPLPSQLPKPGKHAGMHAPPVHIVEPFGLMHGRLQPPQLFTLFWTLVSQPLPELPSQLAKPGAQPS